MCACPDTVCVSVRIKKPPVFQMENFNIDRDFNNS